MNRHILDKDIGRVGVHWVPKTSSKCRNCFRHAGSLCENLSCEELDLMDAFRVDVKKSAGANVFFEGDPFKSYYTITQGVARVQRHLPDGRRVVLEFLYPGDFFGLNHENAYAYSVDAVSDLEMCAFSHEKMQQLFQINPHLERQVLDMFAKKLILAGTHQAALARKSPKEKMAEFLLECFSHSDLKETSPTFELPMPREDIADYLGMTIETVSRVISSFVKEGLIKVESRRFITLLDKKGLVTLAGQTPAAP